MGTLYFFIFQLLGILGIRILFPKEKNGFCLLLGSVTGSFCLQWLPILFSFPIGFTKTAHILGLISLILLFVVLLIVKWYRKETLFPKRQGNASFSPVRFIKEHPCILLIAGVYLYMVCVLWHHTLTPLDGAYMTGQCTYGDMNMHLGFITSIARQKFFPPEYSILPGTKLAYPFLSDSISSSVYLMGASLKWAYLLPMYVALLQVFFGVYLLSMYLLENKNKSILAYILFFFNGGFGIFYFVTKGFHHTNFTRIFTEFYQTPTNYVDGNIQWHNILVDMLIPQRATLFGWAILFPLLYLLLKALKEQRRAYFIPAGILAGGLPLIHTHSFLALGILCCGFLLLDLKRQSDEKKISFIVRFFIVAAVLGALYAISLKMYSDAPLDNNVIFTIGILLVLAFLIYLLYYLVKNISKRIWLTWGVFLGIVLILALPQLFGFTFQQATGDQFTRGGFDWANAGDNYIVFAVKNYGIMFFLVLGVFLAGSRKQLAILLPATFLWLVSEFILFQPNSYDNNKILLAAYLFFCIAVSDFVFDKVREWCKNRYLSWGILTIIIFLGSISALLTMGREAVSEYELYSKGYVEAAAFIEKNTDVDDTFLTATNHNNVVASLTGRDIVCGSSSYLYYHGVNYTQNEADVKTMYEVPNSRASLFQKYGVDYIVVGPNETANYQIPDYDSLIQSYPIVFNQDGVILLHVQ